MPEHRQRVALRPWIALGPLSAALSAAGFVAYLALRHDVSPTCGLRLLAAVYFLFIVPGLVAHRYVFRVRGATPFESLGLSLLLGVLFTPVVWYVLCRIGAATVFAPLVIGLGVVVPLSQGWHRDALRWACDLIRPADAPAALLALLIAVVWSWQIEPVDIAGDTVFVRVHSEHAMHAALVTELARGVPAKAFPFLAGARTWAYHDMPDVWCDLLHRAVGGHAQEVYYFLALPLRYVLLTLGCYLMLVPRFGRWAALLGTACVFLIIEPGTFNANWSWLSYIHLNYATTFGWVGVFAIGFLVSRIDRGDVRGPLLLCAVISALLLWYKANYALAVGPATAMLCAIVLIRRRDYRWLGLCITAQLALVAIRILQISTADLRMPMAIAPLSFLQWWWDVLALPASVRGDARRLIAAMPALVRFPAMVSACLISAFPIGVAATAYAIARCGLLRRRPTVQPFDGFVALTLLCCVVGFVVFPIQPAMVSNVAVPVWSLCGVLLFCPVGAAALDLMRRARRAGSVVSAAAVLAIVAAVGMNAPALRRAALWAPHSYSATLSRGFYDCCRYIAANAPQDAVTLHPRYDDPLFTSALTERRSVFDYAWAWSMFTDTTAVRADLNDFFDGATPRRTKDILDRYGVDYVVADASTRDGFGDSELTRRVFQSGDVAVYRVRDPAKRLLAQRSSEHVDAAP